MTFPDKHNILSVKIKKNLDDNRTCFHDQLSPIICFKNNNMKVLISDDRSKNKSVNRTKFSILYWDTIIGGNFNCYP